MNYLLSLVAGLGVGILYGLLHVRSPAPPVIALIGLLGMLLGEQGVGWARAHSQWSSAVPSSAVSAPPAKADPLH
jgi:XapX domain-containing protein